MELNLSGTLAIDLGNTNTVIAFQDQKDNDSVLIEFVKLFKRDLYTHVSDELHDQGYEYYAVILYPNAKIEIIKSML